MSNPSEKMVKRRVVLADGRYLIFYTFPQVNIAADLRPSITKREAKKKARREET